MAMVEAVVLLVLLVDLVSKVVVEEEVGITPLPIL
jgi:hypothetical protein